MIDCFFWQGAIFFSEFDGLSTLYLSLFFCGVLVICIGVVILSVVTESRKLRQVPPRTKLKAAFLAVYAAVCLKNRTFNDKSVCCSHGPGEDITLDDLQPGKHNPDSPNGDTKNRVHIDLDNKHEQLPTHNYKEEIVKISTSDHGGTRIQMNPLASPTSGDSAKGEKIENSVETI